ncbi:hypothetical protein CQW23_23074 [Capsicum baccatum]|uniref:Protein TAR1 n=1 Tax=Capsicum baccatum TaxID=33114 RepID=A0A2G2VQX4_CAPBA|nr:hypothetical protein CQW23_23074 [Capsicum baccatum]
MAPCCVGAMVPRCYGATVPVCHGALVPRCLCATVPWCHGACVRWCYGATVPVCQAALVPWCLCDTVPWCHGTTPPWYQGAKVPTCHGAMVPWCLGAMAPRCLGALVPWRHGALVPLCHGASEPWCLGALVPWRHGAKRPWCHGARISNLTKTPAWRATGKINLSHDGLNPSHIPCWWVNNPTLGEFCFTVIGRAEIEGSKSNVAMNPWLPQASYPCGNFSDTSRFEFRRSKGSFGHAFMMCCPSQTPHLSMSSAWIGPQSEPWVQKEGQFPASDSRNNRIPLVRTSSELAVRRAGKAPEGTVPSPSPGRHAATRSRHGSSSSSPPTADGFGTGTPVPALRANPFPKLTGSILPTSLAYIVPSTRGCSPWRPDAVMSTTGRGRHSVLRIFKGRRERTGHHATCGALPAAGPYLRLSRFQGGQAVKQKR